MDINKAISHLREYGLEYAEIQVSDKPMYYVERYHKISVTPSDSTYPSFYGRDSSYDITAVETFNLEKLTENNINLILRALHFYSKSRNPVVENLRREYEIMRIMHGESPPNEEGI